MICSDARYSYESSSLEELAEMIEQQEKVISALALVVVIVILVLVIVMVAGMKMAMTW